MTASLLDGKLAASHYKKEIKTKIAARKASGLAQPGLAVILVGNDPASEIYVTNKRKACLEMGIKSFSYDLPATTSENELIHLIQTLNQSPEIDGILVQLPLAPSINSHKIIECIDPTKDVDGFHPFNIGRLILKNPLLRPCTPYGIINLLAFYQIPLLGKHTVVVGASNIVGRPMAMEFLLAGATVTICHRFTKNLEQYIRIADLVVVATGKPDVIAVDWLNDKQIIIDVGIHRLADGRIRGDIDFAQAKEKVAWITPVPGGVGPMTITTLLQNTLEAAKHKSG